MTEPVANVVVTKAPSDEMSGGSLSGALSSAMWFALITRRTPKQLPKLTIKHWNDRSTPLGKKVIKFYMAMLIINFIACMLVTVGLSVGDPLFSLSSTGLFCSLVYYICSYKWGTRVKDPVAAAAADAVAAAAVKTN